jgi:hypothetical protein
MDFVAGQKDQVKAAYEVSVKAYRTVAGESVETSTEAEKGAS